ncbi:hypothetical protein NIES4072_03250 [Nostoc commune NIES-4072]|uniref:Uncharacterized protein n=1 Tax=Nostoc commune NIES-4072 TaxID=2005467 RepID=A0A2R5FFW7_NOSCO|nr:hypothetical protein [Nostoc commune]BBD65996.1 hypothetical protein NIES4070_23570 [Nostoc commune HK-02]GBG16679.1 hypothetical protein NIES4072_03250 [Nostoc commune NIES-4072]
MTNPVKTVIQVNLEMALEVAHELELAPSTQLGAYCLEILREIGCAGSELPLNLQTRDQQLNFITGFASYAFGEVQSV